MPLYASKGLYLTAALYGVYLLMAAWGLRVFLREMREVGQGEMIQLDD